jgi:hypothetical protein
MYWQQPQLLIVVPINIVQHAQVIVLIVFGQKKVMAKGWDVNVNTLLVKQIVSHIIYVLLSGLQYCVILSMHVIASGIRLLENVDVEV